MIAGLRAFSLSAKQNFSMNDEYAIEPTAFSNVGELRYVLSKFGFGEGRFLARYPSNWVKRLYDVIALLPDIERKRMTSILEKVKQDGSLRGPGWTYDGCKSWVDNAALIGHAIAGVAVEKPNHHGFPLLQDILEDSKFFRPSRSERIEACAGAYARVAEPLLSASHQAVLVDPYFDPDRRGYIRTLREFARVGGDKCKEFIAVCNHEKVRSIAQFQSLLDKSVIPCLGPGQQFVLKVVEDFGTARMHGRYLLTDKGGIRFDSGFDERYDGAKVDVEILDRNLWDAHYKDYVQEPSPFKLIKSFQVFHS